MGLFLLTAFALNPVHTVRDAYAQEDIQAIAGAVGMAGILIATLAAGDSGGAGAHCACLASSASTCQAAVFWQHCAFLGVSVAAMIAAAIPIGTSEDTSNAVSGRGFNFSNGIDPNVSLAEQFGCTDLAECGCDGPDADQNPVCSAEAYKKLPEQIALAKQLLDEGKLEAPEEFEGDLGASLDQALSDLNALESGDLAAISGSKAGGSPGKRADDDPGAGYAAIGGGGKGGAGASDGLVAGPVDQSGLGSVLWNGGLDQIDAKTGKSLTLWERATRRYQGVPEKRRAFALARTESIRQKAIGIRKLAEKRTEDIKRRASQLARKLASDAKPKPPTPRPKVSENQKRERERLKQLQKRHGPIY